jgi:hypothetical protein
MSKTFLINTAVLASLLLMIELFLGGWFFSSNNLNNLGIIRATSMSYEQDLYDDSDRVIIYSRDENGLRGISTFNDPSKIDILTVGGSTTDQRYITDNKTWQTFLENNFKERGSNYLISNSGVDGQSTYGHIKNFELWYPNIEGLKPQYIMFYVGINDFFLPSDRNDFDDLDKSEQKSFLDKIEDNSAIYNLIRKIRGLVLVNRANVGHKKMDFSKYKYTDAAIGSPELMKFYQENNVIGFQKRISRLIKLSTEMGAEPIFVTQPSLLYKFKGETVLGISETLKLANVYSYNGVDFYHLLNMLNSAMLEVCEDQYLLVDLTNAPIWDQNDFYDFYHMTPKGAEKVSNEIYNQIKGKLE